jgi:hypothetical protein
MFSHSLISLFQTERNGFIWTTAGLKMVILCLKNAQAKLNAARGSMLNQGVISRRSKEIIGAANRLTKCRY